MPGCRVAPVQNGFYSPVYRAHTLWIVHQINQYLKIHINGSGSHPRGRCEIPHYICSVLSSRVKGFPSRIPSTIVFKVGD